MEMREVRNRIAHDYLSDKVQGIYSLLIESYRPIVAEAVNVARRYVDASRGGDIDLIVFAPGLAAGERLRLSLRIAVAFRSVCDEKIDVHVFDPHDLTAAERAFLGVIRSEPLHPGGRVGA